MLNFLKFIINSNLNNLKILLMGIYLLYNKYYDIIMLIVMFIFKLIFNIFLLYILYKTCVILITYLF